MANLARAEMAKSIAALQYAVNQTGIRDASTLSPLMANLSGVNPNTRGLPRSMLDAGNFGPGLPVPTDAIDVVNPATGRPMPRRYEYPVGYNLPLAPGQGKLVPFRVLRNVADIYDVARRCIEIRKQEVAAIDWDIVPREDWDMAKGRTRIYSGKKPGLVDAYATERKKLRDWFAYPDRIGGLSFGDWMKMAMEEILVVDALSIYEHPTWGKSSGTLDSGLFALEILDGTCIRPLIDYRGSRPMPPNPAYQQFLHGIPRSELMATILDSYGDNDLQAMQRGFDPDANEENSIGFRADQLLYRPYNQRAWTKYGFSSTEQTIMNTNLALKRQGWHRGYFDEGDVPAMLIHVPDNWSLEQLQRYETQWHAMLSGDQGWKHRVKAIPGVEKVEQLKPPFHQMDFDEFLLKITCMGYDMDPQEVGFGVRGSSGGEKGIEELSERKNRTSLRPMLRFFTEMFDDWISRRFGQPALCFRFQGLEIIDERGETEIDMMKIKAGAMSLDAFNAKRGIEPMGIKQAATPNVYLTRDVVPLEDVGVLTMSTDQLGVAGGTPAAPVKGGNAATPSSNGAGGVARSNASPTKPTPARKSPAQPSNRPATAQKVADALNELKALESFMERPRARRFVPDTLPHHLVEEAYERVAEGEAVKAVFADLRKNQSYSSDAVISELYDTLV